MNTGKSLTKFGKQRFNIEDMRGCSTWTEFIPPARQPVQVNKLMLVMHLVDVVVTLRIFWAQAFASV